MTICRLLPYFQLQRCLKLRVLTSLSYIAFDLPEAAGILVLLRLAHLLVVLTFEQP